MAKGAFWLPSFVPVVALPGLADPLRRRVTAIWALAGVLLSAAILTGGAFVFGNLVVRMVGGSAYSELADQVWQFAAAGSLIAVVQLLLYSRLATEDRRAVAPLWGMVFLEVLVIALWRHSSPTEIVTVVVGTSLSLAVAGALVEAAEHGTWPLAGSRTR